MEALLEAGAAMPKERCRVLADGIKQAMALGLKGEDSDLQMLPSFVTGLPTGEECGSFYALDLGGTNFRVLRVVLGGLSTLIKQMKFVLSPEHMQGEGKVLFNFLAESIKTAVLEFEGELPPPDEALRLGFTFSFPVNQTALNSGTLLKWTKGFNAAGVVGEDVVTLLQNSLNDIGFSQVHVDALANDTVGTLLAMANKDPKTAIGVIFGTGTNACYTEKIEKIEKWKGSAPASGMMCINMEWGNFGQRPESAACLPLTKCDEELDAASVHVGNQRLEKLIGGMYLGELCVRFFNKVVDAGEALQGANCRASTSSMTGEVMGRIESLGTDTQGVAEIMRSELELPDATPADAAILVKICKIVSTRAARVGASAILAILEHMEAIGKPTTVGIDGSVFILYPKFKSRMQDCLKEMLGDAADVISLEVSRDGSGIGAALIAATAD